MQKVKLLFLYAGLIMLCSAQKPAADPAKVQWITLDEATANLLKDKRPVLIDLYTDWCGWCKVMDKETYGNNAVASYINENYYAVKFNAESKDSAELGGKKYGYNPSYKANDLAVYLLLGRMGYPSTVLLSSLDAQPAPLSGFLNPSELEAPLKFFGDGTYKNQNFPDFMKSFITKW